jgi:hypothetical protein
MQEFSAEKYKKWEEIWHCDVFTKIKDFKFRHRMTERMKYNKASAAHKILLKGISK